MPHTLYFALAAALIGLAWGAYLVRWVLRQPAGEGKMVEIAKAIQEGAMAYLNRQYRTIGYIGLIIFVLLWWFLGVMTALGFAVGAAL